MSNENACVSPPPLRPQIYHITHGRNLSRIIADGGLWSDAEMIARGGPAIAIGLTEIKERRLKRLTVDCHAGTTVGQFVPFYFCPRSVMLYLLHKGNHPGLTYAGGQRPILHLVADLHEVVTWFDAQGRRWAFTDRNAGSGYFRSFRDIAQLDQLNWEHIANDDFRDPLVKEAKQAEFLVYGSFPWELVQTIGVATENVAKLARDIVSDSQHQPDIQVETAWYY